MTGNQAAFVPLFWRDYSYSALLFEYRVIWSKKWIVSMQQIILFSPAAVAESRFLAHFTSQVQYTSLNQETCNFNWYKPKLFSFVEEKKNPQFWLFFQFKHFSHLFVFLHSQFLILQFCWEAVHENKLVKCHWDVFEMAAWTRCLWAVLRPVQVLRIFPFLTSENNPFSFP